MADVGDMDPCYPTLLIGWKHFIFDNIGPGQGLSRQPTPVLGRIVNLDRICSVFENRPNTNIEYHYSVLTI